MLNTDLIAGLKKKKKNFDCKTMELVTYQGILYLLILCHGDLMYFDALMLADVNRLPTSLTINQNVKPGAS